MNQQQEFTKVVNHMVQQAVGTGHLYGVYRGICLSNVDTAGQGRIKVYVPSVHGGVRPDPGSLQWVSPCVPLAGNRTGTFLSPDVDSYVWVVYENGDKDYPVWFGAWWVSPNSVPPPDVMYADDGTPTTDILYQRGDVCIKAARDTQDVTITDGRSSVSMAETLTTLTTPWGTSVVFEPTGVIKVLGIAGSYIEFEPEMREYTDPETQEVSESWVCNINIKGTTVNLQADEHIRFNRAPEVVGA